jgi:hypothetical protein
MGTQNPTFRNILMIGGMMKIRAMILLGLSTMILTCGPIPGAQVDVNVNDRFSELNQYGDWIEVSGYGRCWRPYSEAGWRPFLYGHWVYSNEGWVWDSDEPFGWIVCHYGNWYNDPEVGWIWVPGYDWSPARVRWYVTEDEIGWAPLFPEPRHGFHRRQALAEWSFCPVGLFAAGGEIREHVAVRDRPEHPGAQAHIYAGPPKREFVQRIARAPVATVNIAKTRVATHASPLIKVEVPGQVRPRVESTVSPRFRKPELGRPQVVPEHDAVKPSVRHEEENPKVRVEPGVRSDTSRATIRDGHEEKQNEVKGKQEDNERREGGQDRGR